MPELPETQTIAAILNENLKGKNVLQVQVSKDYKALPSTDIFIKTITGKQIKSVERVAKNVLLKLDNGVRILFHLAMTGRLLLWKNSVGSEKWVKVILHFDGDTKLTFSDMRMFGKAAVLSPKQTEELTARYGPEPLDENTTPQKLFENLKTKRTNIKNALLDQEVISGLGNIYATDALFLAKINPLTKTNNITIENASQLLSASRTVLNEGIKFGGSTLGDKMYVDPFGKEGTYQEHFKIYSKEKCPVCGAKVSFIKISGRGTYFCPGCQPLTNE
ncbi:MAG: Formamidopyrimidine-DNA glycosylase (Fapy-DNA glycosylase) [candidate division WWE3 bacterium GW2011_GWF2_41_45]|uniref:DNA-formamidopyrimidine glycosylase n=2 Tax=Katanobacteria TaxID=422282 RepID=A0A1F4W3P7_UNCKA|nr:MAG: Formamidopyrimidine-DNA glycosylase (Fapy-DNA glycosylase) [candidate division WWE3 bacterium GW2011_GWC2_41_23]KKS09965.1 MAG: Formamidopyrimidine-DNA glycosylase (Fapy-DNA glycosylase) [candidate division WWE3 bacterium GW2011_GWF2_41_45]KKS19801.1 MAG: Formamidopyrimidine-DNA glycosylase (Fapy-DNA glycosylase) [candidate division WWE3 bacterium GW2011_GWE1_41_72]KKS30245.1 MAG: Formamidopyrimidine-DNA glycosylase (Fapy-DNA glycosylase) [candidate division WWE3 bacterium GW2011_GWD2_42